MSAVATRPLRIVIADDHELFAEGLAEMLADYPDLEVVARATNGVEAVALTSTLSPDLVLMDVDMPCLDGISATRQIVAEGGETRVLMVSSSTEAEVVSAARGAGAAGYLFKGCALGDMIAAIHEAIPLSDLVHAG